MPQELIQELKASLAGSDSVARKRWARQIVNDEVALKSLMSLLHFNDRTSQRFMWLISDVCEADFNAVIPCMPILFSLRNTMSFPGMPRSVAKWLWLTNVPSTVEDEARPQLILWLKDSTSSIGCKSFAAKALFDLANQDRIPKSDLKQILESQAKHANRAYGSRMQKLLERMD